jgi:hypothetical protein
MSNNSGPAVKGTASLAPVSDRDLAPSCTAPAASSVRRRPSSHVEPARTASAPDALPAHAVAAFNRTERIEGKTIICIHA